MSFSLSLYFTRSLNFLLYWVVEIFVFFFDYKTTTITSPQYMTNNDDMMMVCCCCTYYLIGLRKREKERGTERVCGFVNMWVKSNADVYIYMGLYSYIRKKKRGYLEEEEEKAERQNARTKIILKVMSCRFFLNCFTLSL